MKERLSSIFERYAVALGWVYFTILFGLGGTFPGSTVPESSRWKIGPWYVPQWLLRIDYVFISPHWAVRSARVAKFDEVSDHRGVITELVLEE